MHWLERLESAGVPCGPINTYPEALIEQMKQLGAFGLAIPEPYGDAPVSTP